MRTNKMGIEAKVDLELVIKDVLSQMAAIRESSEEQRRKTQKEKRLGAHVRTVLFDDGRKGEGKQIKLSTLNGYLSKVRKALTLAGYKHHSLTGNIEKLAKRHEEYSARLNSWLDMTITDIRADHKELVKELEKSAKGDAKKTALCKALKADSFKIVPEVIRAMQLHVSEKEELRTKQEKNIDTKASHSTAIDAGKLRGLLMDLFASDDDRDLALGVALATCRRQVEVCLLSTFTAIDDRLIKITDLAKKRGGAAEAVVNSLVDVSLVLDAVDRLRSSVYMQKICEEIEKGSNVYTDNEIFNNWSRPYTARAVEHLAKTFGSKAHNVEGWVFKDSRAIGAKASFQLEYARVEKEEGRHIQEMVYFEQCFAHKDKLTQNAYKEWVVQGEFKRVTAKDVQQAKKGIEAARAEYAAGRADRLRELSETADTKSRKVKSILAGVAERVAANPELAITQNWVKAEFGGKATLIVEAMQIIRAAGLHEPA